MPNQGNPAGMEFIRAQELAVPPKEALRRLKRALKQQGFDQTAEIHAAAPTGSEGRRSGTYTLVTASNSQLSPRALEIAPEAALLLTTTFLVHPSAEGSRVGVLDPEVLSLVP
ncbi:MAG: hypothetical protein JSS02_21380 [Planctomycetes bacterium]|nr:hypothetical protein [Planctomycetota bacterium]